MQKYKFSIAACARWEEKYIIEWIEYHKSIGFEHFYIYSNDDDAYTLRDVLFPYLNNDTPIVTYRHYPYQGQQRAIYLNYLENLKDETEWVMFLDIDEFLALKEHASIGEFMLDYENEFDSVYFNWFYFGNSGHKTRPDGNVLLNYTQRKSKLHPYTKHITRTQAIDLSKMSKTGAVYEHFWHYWESIPGLSIRSCNVIKNDEMGKYYKNFPSQAEDYLLSERNSERIMNKAVINHYAIKSEDDFLRRVERGTQGDFRGQTMWRDLYTSNKHIEELASMNEVTDNFLFEKWKSRVRDIPDIHALVAPAGINIAPGKIATQSSLSRWSIGSTLSEDAQGALSGKPSGHYSFHTDLEMHPWWMIDLQDIHNVKSVRIFNRVDDPATAMRSRKLRLFGSIDDNDWMELYTRAEDRPFGGVDGYPLTIDLKNSHIRYIKIDLDDENYLHLDKIEVYI